MLVPVQGGVQALQKRNRQIFAQEAALSLVEIPNVYIFNVGPRVWKGVGAGREWTIPPCPKGARRSEPIAVPMLNLSEIDLADGGNNLGIVIDPAVTGIQKQGTERRQVNGVVDDIIGRNSTTRELDLFTTNGEWFGVFSSATEEPTDEEIEAASDKLHQMAQLVYQTGAEKVQAGDKVRMEDRKLYNWATQQLGLKPLWGNLEHTMSQCPECGEDIREGANVCKHCHLAIDEQSVKARAQQRARENAEILGAAATENAAAPAKGKGKKKAGPGENTRPTMEMGE